MTNPPTDERREAFEAWAKETMHEVKLVTDGPHTGEYIYPYTRSAWSAYQAALSHQGEVVKVSELRAFVGAWQRKADGLGFPYGEDYLGCRRDLTALISKAEKV